MTRIRILNLATIFFVLLLAFKANSQTTLISAGSSWKYLDDGSDQGTTWRSSTFNDGSWKTGNAQLGYGEGDEATVISFGTDPNNKHITTYFRKTISIPDISIYPTITARIKRDDGIVMYINGVEVLRDNMPTGTINFKTLASSAASDDGQIFNNFSLKPSDFINGSNVITIEVHQNQGSSSDLSFDFELLGSSSNPTIFWFWSGGLTSTSIRVNGKASAACTTRVAVSTNSDLSNPIFSSSVLASLEKNYTVAHSISGLTAGTQYYYGFEVNGTLDKGAGRIGTFKTIRENTPYSFKFALSSCGNTGSSSVVYDSIRTSKPDFFIITGDFFYADIASNNINLFRNQYEQVLTAPRQNTLYKTIPIAYTWDDHDYGPNNSDASAPGKEASIAAYKEIVPSYPLVVSDAIYQAFTVGRVRFILTDLRSQKVPATANMMGAPQLTWFKNECLKAKQEGKFIAWVSSVPYLSEGTGNDGVDNWASYTAERREIADYLQANGINNIFILSGDAHMVAIDDGSNSDYSSNKKGPAIPIFQAAALDRTGSYKGGPYSLGAFQGGGQFGLVEVTDNGGENICIKFRGRNFNQKNDLISHSFCANNIVTAIKKGVEGSESLKLIPSIIKSGQEIEMEYNVPSSGEISIEVVDAKGVILYNKKLNVNKGLFKHQLLLGNIPEGLYHILLKGEKECVSQKLLVK